MAAVPPAAKVPTTPAPAAPVAKVSGPAPSNTNLNTFSTGVLGTKFKKGDTWDVGPADWTHEKVGLDTSRKIAGKAAGSKDITYMNYDLATLKAEGFPQDSIATLDDKYKIGKTARIYAKTIPELEKMEPEFQKAVDAYRTAQLKPMLAEKKAANQKEWNSMTSGISVQTKAELDGLTQEYLKKKADLEKKLEAAFKAQTKQLVINKQWETQDKYRQYVSSPRLAKPGVKVPEGAKGTVSLSGALDAAGQPIINSIKIPSTRKRHRFIHLLVKPGDTVVPAPAASVDTRTPENIALAAAQAKLAASEAALKGVAAAGAPGAPGPPLLKPLQLPPRSPGPLDSPPASPLPPPPQPPLLARASAGGSRKRKTKRKKPHRSSK